MRAFLLGLSFSVATIAPALAAGVAIVADRDATLIEDANGSLANGAGPVLFAGRNNAASNSVRRALVRFDLAVETRGDRPAQAALEHVAVVLTNTTESNAAPCEYRLHRLLADWGEGTSSTTGGSGAPATQNDATWVHGFYPDASWLHNGAQFDGEPSARLIVAGPGVYRFEGDGLTRDVEDWARDPRTNFGWILIGDEARPQTARAFGSRENADPGLRPVLELTYRDGR
jgi:hypothetical protein